MQGKFCRFFNKIKKNSGISFNLKEKQRVIIHLLAKKTNVLAVLPTGYGKSLIYAILPLLLDEVNNGSDSTGDGFIVLQQSETCCWDRLLLGFG